ncbi:MAG: hypothetical protein JXB10_18420 [Pirellulales bacterium]|nr:hypothetical protein [Pirellulales bacterium]
MKAFWKTLFFAAVCFSSLLAEATDRIYRDIVVQSPNKRYEARAESPDNKEAGYKAFQANFVYTLKDKKSGKVLWTRKQPMEKPVPLTEGSSRTYSSPQEASPVAIYVSDSGWTVIETGWNELIVVDLHGKDRCRIELLKEALTPEENKKYVHQTTAGPMWEGLSLRHFLKVGKEALFIIRPWWGRNIVINLAQGKIIPETAAISKAIAKYQHDYVLAELKKGIESRKKLHLTKKEEQGHRLDGDLRIASYLAGVLKVVEAVPLLRQLEDYNYSGCSVSGGLGALEKYENEVNPHDYEVFTLRQKIQLSLRRLGVIPKPLPGVRFRMDFEDFNKSYYYDPPALKVPRHENADKIQKGMKAEQVLALLGGPDFVCYGRWEYDMDGKPPFTLILQWDAHHVIGVKKKTPPLWQKGFCRDEQVVR